MKTKSSACGHILLMLVSVILVQLTARGQSALRPGIQSLVHKLEKEKIMHLGAPTGYSGKPETNNKYYKLYRRLEAKARENELLELVNSPAPTIKLYAYSILHNRAYSGLKIIFLQHLNDSTEFWMAGGCTGVIDRVNAFMLRRLNPAHANPGKTWLTKEEFGRYSKALARKDLPWEQGVVPAVRNGVNQ